MHLEEGLLLVVHPVVREPFKPLEPVRHGRQRIGGGDQVGAERHPDRPVQPLAGVTGVLDVADEVVDENVHPDLIARDPVDGVGQQLGEPDRPAGEIPQTAAGAAGPPGQEHAALGADDDFNGEPGYLSEDFLVFPRGEWTRHGAVR